MKKILMVLLALVVLALPVWAYNSKPSGVAYEDPNLSELWLNGTRVTSSAAELNLLDGFSALSMKSLSIAGGVSIPGGSSNVATQSVSGLTTNDTLLWARTSAVATAASRSILVANLRVSATNEIEITTVNASDSALTTPAATIKYLVVR